MEREEKTVIIIGIDPGTRLTGYGIIEKQGNQLKRVTSGRIRAGDSDVPLPNRLAIIYEALSEIMRAYSPTHGAIEGIFTARNAMSSLKLGHARGVAMLAMHLHNIELHEYPPATIKQAVAGNGRASKDTVQFMVKRVLNLSGELLEDESDALAIAICHSHTITFQQRLR